MDQRHRPRTAGATHPRRRALPGADVLIAALSAIGPVLVAALLSAQGSTPYAPPRSGWLYLIDSNTAGKEGRLLIVDPADGHVAWSRSTGYMPDMALSPDGKRLYLTETSFSPVEMAHLEVIDTSTGQTVQDVTNPDRATSTLDIYTSRMAVSPDGRWLFQAKMNNEPGNATYYVDTFDTQLGAFLRQHVPTPSCVWPSLIPTVESGRLAILCADTQDLRVLTPTAPAPAVQRVPLASTASTGTSTASATALAFSEPNGLTVIMGDGRTIGVETGTPRVRQAGAIDWLAGHWIKQQTPVLSRDATELYMGLSSLAALKQGRQPFEQVVVLDAQTLARRRTLTVRHEFETLALSLDGSQLYLIDGKTATVRVVNTATGDEIRSFIVGKTPVFALVAP